MSAQHTPGTPDHTGTKYEKLHAKWRKGRQELASLNRAHIEVLAQRDALLALVKLAIEPDATQAKADAGMCAQWDVDALALIASIEATGQKGGA